MKKIVVLSLLVLLGCQKNYNVIPYEDGINEVNYTHRSQKKALTVSLRWADAYCGDRGQDFVVVKREQDYRRGLIDDKAAEGVNLAVNIAETVASVPVVSSVLGDVSGYVAGRNEERLLFRCVARK